MSQIILTLLLAGQSAAQVPAPTTQQMFDQATKAAEELKCAEAVPLFEKLESNARLMRNETVRAAIELRKGVCLLRLGRVEEGEPALLRALPTLASRGNEFGDEVRRAHFLLGHVEANRFDYAAAATEFKRALEGVTGSARLQALMPLAQVLTFDRDGEALRFATEARTIALADPALGKREVAAVQTQFARVLLNEGREKEAYSELKDSLRKQGGLDMSVGVFDLATRSDLAIAASLIGDREAAQKYLVYTGAGRFKESPFARATSMQHPLCGAATGLKPDDYAIIEFSLAEDGHVQRATPIYSTGGRSAAVAFARAVAGWSWSPEAAKAIPPLFRYMTRIEIRCTTAGERPPPTLPLAAAYADWIEGLTKTQVKWQRTPDAKAVPLQRAALAEGRSSNDRSSQLSALVALGTNPVLTNAERSNLLSEAVRQAEAMDAPVSARSHIAIAHLTAKSQNGRQLREMLRTFLARPEVAADPLSAATARLLVAARNFRVGPAADAEDLLKAVATMPQLPNGHPLKVAALLELANQYAAKADIEGARKMFEQTGLTAEQCAFIGLQPAMRRTGVSSTAYPVDAGRMGFEGWLRTEFDVATDGSTIQPRILTAYPPMVFNDAGIKISKGMRYTASYRPENGVACTARQESVAFRMPEY